MIDILYIDDESGTERFSSTVELLAVRGYRVIPVSSVTSVTAALNEHKGQIAAIVLDIMMPPLQLYSLEETDDGTHTGLLVLRDIRKQLPRIPIVIVSVQPRSRALEPIKEHVVAAYLQRPAVPSEIADALDQALRPKR